MAPVYKIAIIQMAPKPVAVEENFATASEHITKAAADGAHIAVLPEYHLTSWVPDHPDFIASTQESMTYLPRYQTLARELNISIVPGTICEVHPVGSGDDEVRNMAYFVEAGTGDITSSYQKKNLWHPERKVLTSSGHSPHMAFDTPLKHADGAPVRAGMLVCWDLAFPEAFRRLVADGADLIIIPSWWYASDAGDEALAMNPEAEKLFLESTTLSRACENTAAVVFCNAGGLSGLFMPIMGAIKKISIGDERMEIAEFDLNVLKVAEDNYKIREDMSRSGWHYKYKMGGKDA
ncbi:carbon-nitrogen hydrolase domain-containing protein [Sarocladium implicatum]|nr:carbon-nitrogen hydrolase domain-containing protein [Sarocladium implicatum]